MLARRLEEEEERVLQRGGPYGRAGKGYFVDTFAARHLIVHHRPDVCCGLRGGVVV